MNIAMGKQCDGALMVGLRGIVVKMTMQFGRDGKQLKKKKENKRQSSEPASFGKSIIRFDSCDVMVLSTFFSETDGWTAFNNYFELAQIEAVGTARCAVRAAFSGATNDRMRAS